MELEITMTHGLTIVSIYWAIMFLLSIFWYWYTGDNKYLLWNWSSKEQFKNFAASIFWLCLPFILNFTVWVNS